MPETSKIADGISEAFRRVDPVALEAGRRWGQEIQRGLSGVDVELEADTAKAEAELNEAARDRKTTTEMDADTAKAEEQMDTAARDRRTKVKVDIDQSDLTKLTSMLASGDRAQAGAFSGFLRARRDLMSTQFKDPLDFADSILKFQNAESKLAPSVSGALSAAMPSVGSALTVALIGGAVAAAAGVAGALSGAIGLIPAGLGGGVAVIGTLITGLDGVGDAWTAAGKAADSATKDQAEKSKAVTSAQKSLRDAVQDEASAQRDVANARKDARQQLEDLNLQLRGGVLDEREAILSAAAARRDLATGRYKDAIDYQQAQLRVEQMDERVLEAHKRNVDMQQKATEATAKGVEGSDQVVAANQRYARSQENVATAQQNLAEAQSKTSSNADALATAMAKLSPGAQAFVGSLRELKPAWDALKFSVQDSLLGGLGPQLQSLATQYLPVLRTGMTGLAGTMNTAFKDVSGWLSKPETMATIQQIVANIGSSFQLWSQSLVPFSQAFLTISQVGSGFLPGLGKMITDGANAFNNFITSAARSGELQQWMQLGIQALGEMMRLVRVVGKLFLDLAPMAVPALQEITGLLGQFSPILRLSAGLLAQHPGLITAVVVAFGTWKAISAVGTVLTALEGISAALKVLPAEATAAGTGMAAGLAPILGTLTAAATALALFNSHGDSAPTNIGPGAQERQRKLDAGKAYADAHGGRVPDGYQQWLDKDAPMPKELAPYYVPGAKPGTPFYDAQGRALDAQGKPFESGPAAAMPNAGSWFGGGGRPATRGFGLPPAVVQAPVPAVVPSAGTPTGAGSDGLLLAGVPAGRYLQTQAADLTQGIGDCSSAVEDLINMMDGVATAGRGMSTGNASKWLTQHGFVPTSVPMPGTFQVGFSPEHMQATLPGGTNFNWGSDSAAAKRGVGGTGAWDSSFTQHYYRPAGAMPNLSQYSVAGMPTVASPYGLSPSGMPLGTQQSPIYVQPAGSGGQQLGQDILSGFLEIFGIDGSVFKNPLEGGLFQGFKGLMGVLTGGGKGQQGLPASAFGAMGGDGAALPAFGGGDLLGGLGNMLQGAVPQPMGPSTPGGPMQAPDEYQPMMPGSGGNTGLPSAFAPKSNGQNGATVNNSQTYVLNGTPPPGANDFVNGISVPNLRGQMRSPSLPGG